MSAPASAPVEFHRAYREGRRFSGTMMVVYVRRTEGRLGVGVTTGRRFGSAVVRNRAKRRLREAVRRLWGRLCDRRELVLVARPPILTAPFLTVVGELEALCAAAGVVPERGSDEAGR